MENENTNGTQAVTHEELSVLSGHLSARLDRIETLMATKDDVQRLEVRMDRFEQTLTTTLKVVQSIDRQLADLASLKTLPERVSRLEDEVLKLKARR